MELMFVHTYTRLETTWTSLKMTSSSPLCCNCVYIYISLSLYACFYLFLFLCLLPVTEMDFAKC